MKSRFFKIFAAAALVLMHLSAHAVFQKSEDIDLFRGTTSDEVKPANLMIILDNAAAFSASASETCVIGGTATALSGTVGGVEQCALYNVIDSQTVDNTASVRIGIMVYNASNVTPYSGSCASGGVGGCLVLPLTGLTLTTKPLILAWIKSWTTSGGAGPGFIKASQQATAAAMQETWAYYYGKTGISGTNYASIIPNTDCKNFVVFIGNAVGSNGTPGDSAPGGNGPKESLNGTNTSTKNADPAATTAQKVLLEPGSTSLVTSCGTLNLPSSSTHDSKGLYMDEWARYLKAQRITTYGVGFIGDSCKPDYPFVLKSAANVSGGKYFEVSNYAALKDALDNIFSEIRSVNSVFAAVSLPVSVNSQGTYLNQVFIGMFRPDAQKYPRWNGNLKQYKLGFDASNNFNLLDADSVAAISSSGSEFISECARSFWTPVATTSGDGYWTSLDTQNCSAYPASSNSPDGNIVEKGGQGYTLRSITASSRVVKTCDATVTNCQTALTDFSTTNVTTTHLGVSASSHTAVVNWAKGQNSHLTSSETAVLSGTAITASNIRPSVHGDIVHSRPVAVNMGTDAVPKVVVVYGGNDGVLRAINGNRTATFTVNGTTSVTAGSEFWSFIPPEFYGKISRLYNNTDTIDTTSATGTPKSYAMDGPIGAYRATNGDAYIYVNMRRGGRALYAFKIDATTLAVSLVWKRGCADTAGTNCSAAASGDFSAIGQTWSAPTVFTARGYGSGTTPLLMIGGGYDTACEDLENCTAATQGNRIYVLDAISGVLQTSFTTIRSVVADMTVVTGSDGHADIIYTADMGGNIYRIQGTSDTSLIASSAPGAWTLKQVASLGCATITTCTTPPNRKFMFAPDVVVDGSDYIVLVGSGDREKPSNITNSTVNYFFMIRDRPETTNWNTDTAAVGPAPTGGCGPSTTTLCLAALLEITPGTTPSDAELAAKKGWYLKLGGNLASTTNEQVVTGAIAVFGTVYFTSHEPKAAASNACVPNLGTSRAYAVKYKNAAAARTSGDLYVSRDDAGLAPDLVVGKVTLDSGQTVPFCIGCEGPIKPSQPVPPSNIQNPAKIRSYWYIQK